MNKEVIIDIENPKDNDLISRQAVLDCFKKWQPYMATRLHEFERELSDLPSIKPQEPKTGHWYSDCRDDYFICNQCKTEFERFSQGGYELIDDYNYCPNCGADMRDKQHG